MSSFSTEEKTNLLFKKLLGKPSTLNTREFFEEPSRPARPAIIATKQIWADPIDATAPSDLSSLTDSSTDNSGSKLMAYSYNGKTSTTNASIRRYIKVQLTMVAGSGGASWEAVDIQSSGSHPNGYADGSTQSDTGTSGTYGRVLQDAIPFNYDSGGSYNVSLYRDSSGQAGTTIPFGSAGGDWNLDIEAGVVTFYEYSTVSSFVDENKPIYISFYKYSGQKGLATNTQVNTFTGGDETTENPLTSDDLKAVQVGNQNIGALDASKYSEALQFGTNNNGAWRILTKGGGGTPSNAQLMIQMRLSGSWVTKGVFNA